MEENPLPSRSTTAVVECRRKGASLCSRMEIEFLSFHLDLTSTCSIRRYLHLAVLLPPFVHRRVHNRVGMHSSRYTVSHEIRNGGGQKKRKKERERGRGKKHRKGVAIERDTREKKREEPPWFRYTKYRNPVAPFLPLFFLFSSTEKGLKNCLNERSTGAIVSMNRNDR